MLPPWIVSILCSLLLSCFHTLFCSIHLHRGPSQPTQQLTNHPRSSSGKNALGNSLILWLSTLSHWWAYSIWSCLSTVDNPRVHVFLTILWLSHPMLGHLQASATFFPSFGKSQTAPACPHIWTTFLINLVSDTLIGGCLPDCTSIQTLISCSRLYPAWAISSLH